MTRTMDHNQIIEYGLSKPGTTLRYPFDPDLPVLFVADKMFALLGGYNGSPSVNLKTAPEHAWIQRQQYPNAVLPGYHMNKTHWNTVILDGTVPDPELLSMVDDSYQLVVSKLPKNKRDALVSP